MNLEAATKVILLLLLFVYVFFVGNFSFHYIVCLLSYMLYSVQIQLKYLAEEMQAVSKGLEKVMQELTASENDGLVSESFCKASPFQLLSSLWIKVS